MIVHDMSFWQPWETTGKATITAASYRQVPCALLTCIISARMIQRWADVQTFYVRHIPITVLPAGSMLGTVLNTISWTRHAYHASRS
jgi:hypothetical protein